MPGESCATWASSILSAFLQRRQLFRTKHVHKIQCVGRKKKKASSLLLRTSSWDRGKVQQVKVLAMQAWGPEVNSQIPQKRQKRFLKVMYWLPHAHTTYTLIILITSEQKYRECSLWSLYFCNLWNCDSICFRCINFVPSWEPGRASAEITGVSSQLAADTLYIRADPSTYCVSRGGSAHKKRLISTMQSLTSWSRSAESTFGKFHILASSDSNYPVLATVTWLILPQCKLQSSIVTVVAAKLLMLLVW